MEKFMEGQPDVQKVLETLNEEYKYYLLIISII